MKFLTIIVKGSVYLPVLFVLSCTKDVEISPGEMISGQPTGNAIYADEFSTCKLRKIDQVDNGVAIYGSFSYGSGKPMNLVYGNYSTPTNRDHYFEYDSKGRLRKYRITYPLSTRYNETHLYGYNASNVIVVDTLIKEGGHIDFVYVSHLTYDSQGRIVKEVIRNIQNPNGQLEPTRYPTYTYDSRGNLGVSGWPSSRYDYKVSIFRAHPVFMFIHRNYSRNNAAPQPRYNSRGLPLSNNPANDKFFNSQVTTRAVYDCQ